MLVKSQVKYIQSLGHKKFRDADRVFVAEGPKIVNELLESERLNLIQCFGTREWLASIPEHWKARQRSFIEVNEKEMERISFLTTPNQVLAVFSKPDLTEAKVEGLILLLENIQDPGNLGTIVRTADWFGVKRIVCSQDTVDVFNPKVIQSAMGSIIRVELLYTDLKSFIHQNPEYPLFASALDGKDLKSRLIITNAFLLMGNESKGISAELESMAYERIRIPGSGGAESLNVAVATGILLSQFEKIS